MNRKVLYPDFKNNEPELFSGAYNSSIFWLCPNCNQDTNCRDWIICCSRECLKQWLEKTKDKNRLENC